MSGWGLMRGSCGRGQGRAKPGAAECRHSAAFSNGSKRPWMQNQLFEAALGKLLAHPRLPLAWHEQRTLLGFMRPRSSRAGPEGGAPPRERVVAAVGLELYGF